MRKSILVCALALTFSASSFAELRTIGNTPGINPSANDVYDMNHWEKAAKPMPAGAARECDRVFKKIAGATMVIPKMRPDSGIYSYKIADVLCSAVWANDNDPMVSVSPSSIRITFPATAETEEDMFIFEAINRDRKQFYLAVINDTAVNVNMAYQYKVAVVLQTLRDEFIDAYKMEVAQGEFKD